ncbi:reverse transcriptase domain-containing protein [Tanacetum coccineum]
MPRECLRIIESKSKVRNSRNKPVVAKVGKSTSTPGISPDVAELKDMVKALLLDKKSQAPTPVKAVEESCVTCGGVHSYRNCPATNGNVYRDNIQEYVSQAAAANYHQGNTGYQAPITNQIRPPGLSNSVGMTIPLIFGYGSLPSKKRTNPVGDMKGITTRSGVAYQGPTIPTTSSSPKVVEHEIEPVVNFVSALMPNPKPSFPYHSRRNDERHREKANDQIKKFYKIFKDLSFEISLTDALILMPKFATTLKALIENKEKLSEMARTPMDECLALDDLGASINLMPLSVWKRLSLPELTPTFMNLEIADRSITKPIGITEDVSVKVGVFHFPADFVVKLFPEIRKELKVCEAKTDKSSIDEPPEVELKDLPPHLEYTFLEGDDMLLVIIAKDLSVKEKATLIKVLKSRKLMEEDYKPAVQHQRRVNPKIHDVIKKEVEKLLDAGLIYLISDSP